MQHRTKDGRWVTVDSRMALVTRPDGPPEVMEANRDVTERRRADDVRARLAAIVESSEDAIISKTLDGVIRTWNAGAEQVFGYASAEAVGQPITLIIPLERRDEESDILARLRNGERVEHFETVRVAKGGRRIDVSLTVSPLRDGAGHIVGASKVVRDVTGRKRADAALKHSQALLGVASRLGRMGAWSVELPDLTVMWSDELRAILELPADHAPSVEEGLSLYPSEYRDTMREAFFACVQNGIPLDVEVQTDTARGGRLWVRIIGEAIRDTSGAVVRVQGAFQDISDRKRAEEAVRVSDERLRLALRGARGGAWNWNLGTGDIWWSPELYELWGVEPGTPTDLANSLALVHEDDRELIRAAAGEAVAGGSVYHCEFRIRHSARGERWMASHGQVVLDGSGRPTHLLGMSFDVTDRRRAEQVLRDRERLLGIVTGSAGVGLVVVNERYEYLFVNAAYAEIFDLDPDRVTGRRVPDLLAAGWPQIRPRLDRALAGESVAYELTLPPRASGDGPRWFRVMYEPRAADAGPPAVVVVVVDVTEQKRTEQAIREGEDRYRLLLDVLPDAVFVHDGSRVVFCNPALVRLLGAASADDLLGKYPFDLAHPDYHARLRERVAAMNEVGRPSPGLEMRVVRLDGRAVPVYSVTTLLSPLDRPEYLVALSDLTERKKLENQFRQAQKMEAVGQLAGGVAHDFNNLLTVINGYSDLLLMSASGSNREALDAIRDAGERAAGLTSQLLAFSRQSVLEPRVLDPNAVVAEAGKMLTRLIGEDVRLSTALDPRAGRVRVDPGQFGQVLMNLAVNARDAMPTGGRLTIETRAVVIDEVIAHGRSDLRPGRYVMVAVSDTGGGMTEEVKARVFEPFFTTKGGKGTGLGLATVFGIVKQSEGHVEVYSEVGVGTTFKIYLPRVDAPDALDAAEQVSVRGGTERVLLVEDQADVRKIALITLQTRGYSVVAAADGPDALRAVEAGPLPDLLLTDVVMPGMSGRELAETLRARFPDLKVLYMSGYTDDAVMRHGILQDAVAFIRKPYTPFGLAQKVREVLDRT